MLVWTQQDGKMVTKCSAHSNIALTWRCKDAGDGPMNARQAVATCWKTTERSKNEKEQGEKKKKKQAELLQI